MSSGKITLKTLRIVDKETKINALNTDSIVKTATFNNRSLNYVMMWHYKEVVYNRLKKSTSYALSPSLSLSLSCLPISIIEIDII